MLFCTQLISERCFSFKTCFEMLVILECWQLQQQRFWAQYALLTNERAFEIYVFWQSFLFILSKKDKHLSVSVKWTKKFQTILIFNRLKIVKFSMYRSSCDLFPAFRWVINCHKNHCFTVGWSVKVIHFLCSRFAFSFEWENMVIPK